MENGGYFFSAFAIVWAFTFLYVLMLLRRQRRLDQEIASLKEALKERDARK